MPRLIPALLTTIASCLILNGCGQQSPQEPSLVFQPEELSSSIRPQDNFYDYVNGNWIDATEIPAEWPRYGVVIQLVERTEQQIKALLSGLQAKDQPDGSEQQKINDLYLSFMDTEAVNAVGATAIESNLQRISEIKNHADIPAYLGEALAEGITGPVDFYIDADGADPETNRLYFWQSGLTLPDRDYYLVDSDKHLEIRAAMNTHIVRLFELAGLSLTATAADDLLELESALAQAQWSRVQSRDRETIYTNKFTPDQAEALTGGFDWNAFALAMGFANDDTVILAQDSYFAELGGVLTQFAPDVWQNYLRLRVVKHYAPYLSTDIVAENFDFDGRVLRGQTELRARDKRAVQLLNRAAGEMLGKLYAAEYFPPEYKARMEELVENLRKAYAVAIDELTWMSPETKQAAQKKLQAFNYKIGYPDVWRDYSALTIRADDLAGNVRRANRFEHQRQLGKLLKPVDRSEWGMTPQTVNAYYRPTFNEIVFPAAFLQAPFFDPAADDAHNYAAIGSVIGHEFSHGFDDQGRKFDESGRLRNWWTKQDGRQFEALSQGLVRQYSGFRALPDVNVNGQLTLGENIADLAGLVMAYKAYKMSLNGQPAPVIDGFSAEERFFIGYALTNRSKWREEFLRKILLSDPHSPDRYRVLGVLPHMPEFYETFGVTEGDGMYLPPEKRVKIW